MSIYLRSVRGYLSALKSYLAKYRIYFIPQEYKSTVKEPKVFREEELAVDQNDIRKILLNRETKDYQPLFLHWVSAGCREKKHYPLGHATAISLPVQ